MNNNQLNVQLNSKKTGYSWTKLYGIKFTDLSGFDSERAYNEVHITSEDFLNRAACCSIEKPLNPSRREASLLKRKITSKDY